MKAVILVGGTGTRLRPVTHIINKNLLPIYNKPAIYYAVELVRDSGIEDVCLVGEHNYLDDFKLLLGNGSDFNLHITYENDSPARKGPASALYAAKRFVGKENVLVYFSDNIFDINIKQHVQGFDGGAVLFTKTVKNPEQYGVVQKDKNGKVLDIEEKPTNPKSNLISTGLQIYDNNVFEYLENQEPGFNGEYMLSDINNIYLKKGNLSAVEIKGFWQDIGTFDGLHNASNHFYKMSKKKANVNSKTKQSYKSN